MSMAAGEYVSVSSQADTEQADLARERQELATQGEFERDELAAIYAKRGLEPPLARQVAEQLMASDALVQRHGWKLGLAGSPESKNLLAEQGGSHAEEVYRATVG
jgi:VIT1/CCC1 family predicted Fe2+/Mn2+ transporter